MLETTSETPKIETMSDFPSPIQFSESAALKVKDMIAEEGNPKLNLRAYVTGGGCSGFQYGFAFDETINEDDTSIAKHGVNLIVDAVSFQYLAGAEIDYEDGLEGALFLIKNQNDAYT